MNHMIRKMLLAAAALGATAAAQADNAMYNCKGADGRMQLTNVPLNDQCEKQFDYAAPAPEAPAPVAAAPAAAPAVRAPVAAAPEAPAATEEKPSPKREKSKGPGASPVASIGTPRTMNQLAASNRRNDAVQETANAYANGDPASVQNPAVNRRYLKTDRATYIQNNGEPAK